jgi:SRSO17 transposase
MTGEDLLKMADALDDYYREFDGCCSRSEGRDMIRRFARGQLGPLERKSLEPIADSEGVAPRALQWFFCRNGWDEERVLERHQQRVAAELSGPDGIFIVDETSDAKKGEWTAGVAHQYCGESGKLDHCIVSVHTAYARAGQHCLLDGELFVPEGWNPDAADPLIERKRARAQLPAEVVHRPKTVMALEQLQRALAHGVAGRYVTADELYGGAPWWRRELAALGLIYVVEVPNRVYGWIDQRHGEAQPLKTLAATHPRLKDRVRKRYVTHETDKGPEVWACRRVVFIEQAEAAPQGPQTLLVARNVRTQEVKFFLVNAPRTMSTAQCLKVAFSRWRVERCFEDCKGELGLNHAELRTYRGLRRHLILTAVNYYFLQTRVWALGEKRPDGFAARRRPPSDCGAAQRGHHERATAAAAGRTTGPRPRTDPAAQPHCPYLGQTTTGARAGGTGHRS